MLLNLSIRAATPSTLNGRRILIAEDEGLIALELENVLQDLGCEVVGPVSRVGDVLKEVRARQLHGALLDVNLRGEQIFPILPDLVAEGVPMIITSGYNDPTLFPKEFRELPRIPKPIDAGALHALCLEIFAARH